MANYDLTYEGSEVQKILDTGDELQNAGYIFRGEATPSTVPGTPTERVAYIGGPGTYTNFGGSITVGAGCICVFKYTGSSWSNQVINTGLDSAVNTLQSAITAINNNIGNGYVYAGVATPSTSPVTGKVFYLAVQAGTYTNFGNAVVTAGLNVIKYNGSAWSVDQVIAIDAEPTQGSDHLVKSGGVLGSIIQNGPAFDLSAYNAQGGVLATYADLSAALTALNALPADFKKGGMSIKFVLSSDNKYVQFRYTLQYENTNTGNAKFVNVANWQEEDVEKINKSVSSINNTFDNIVIGDNFYGSLNGSEIASNATAKFAIIRLVRNDRVWMVPNSGGRIRAALLKTCGKLGTYDLATGQTGRLFPTTSVEVVVQDDVAYLHIQTTDDSGANRTPSRIIVNNYEMDSSNKFVAEQKKLNESVLGFNGKEQYGFIGQSQLSSSAVAKYIEIPAVEGDVFEFTPPTNNAAMSIVVLTTIGRFGDYNFDISNPSRIF
jgi:hypothetical protein